MSDRGAAGSAKLNFRQYLQESGAVDAIVRVLKEVYELDVGTFSQPAAADVLLTSVFQRMADPRLQEQLAAVQAENLELQRRLVEADRRYQELLDRAPRTDPPAFED